MNLVTKLKASEFSALLWVEAQRLPQVAQSRYHLYRSSEYSQDLNVDKLLSALQVVVNKNYNLRSYFVYEDKQLYQVILRESDVFFEKIQSSSSAYTTAYIKESAEKPFDFSGKPLYRFVLIENLYNNSYTLLLCFHHIILDGTQFDALTSQIEEVYHSSKIVNQGDIESLILFERYLSLEEEMLKNINIQKSIEQIESYSAFTELPCRSLIIDKFKQSSVSKSGILKGADYENVHNFSRNYNYSVFEILKASLAVMLHTYSQQESMLISYPISIRKNEFLAIKGSLVNSVFSGYSFKDQTFFSILEEQDKKKKHDKNTNNFWITPLRIQSLFDISNVNVSISMISTRYEMPMLSLKKIYYNRLNSLY